MERRAVLGPRWSRVFGLEVHECRRRNEIALCCAFCRLRASSCSRSAEPRRTNAEKRSKVRADVRAVQAKVSCAAQPIEMFTLANALKSSA